MTVKVLQSAIMIPDVLECAPGEKKYPQTVEGLMVNPYPKPKKKKKGKKKKKNGITGGDAIDLDVDDESNNQYQQFDDGRSQESLEVQYPGQHLEEVKMNNHQSMSRTRLGAGDDDGSMLD